MPTINISVGTTTATEIASCGTKEVMDVLIQNLSANNVYIGSDQTVTTGTGLKIIANGSWANDHRREQVWAIADGASSDVRIALEIVREGKW